MKYNKSRWLLLALVIASYTFMYTQSDRYATCDDDCQKVGSLYSALLKNRPYIYSVARCSWNRISDTLCIAVKDTTGVNWNLLADTVCLLATQNSLYKQRLFIMRYDTTRLTVDTLLTKQCP
jgi:hypothetical protein